MSFTNFTLLLSAGGTPTTDQPPVGLQTLFTFMPLLLMVGVFYLLLIKPQKKRAKKEKEMRENLQIADEVVTTGGIIGRVLSIKDDTVLIETGGDRTRIRVLRSCIAENRTIHDS